MIEDLKRKMVFVGGPRQAGKTIMSLDILGGDEMELCFSRDNNQREVDYEIRDLWVRVVPFALFALK